MYSKSIIKYIEYLKQEHHLNISIHGDSKQMKAVLRLLAPYNIHSNPYCMYVKTVLNKWDKCLCRQKKIIEQCGADAYFDVCPCGVGEFIIPITCDGGVIGYIACSGYGENDFSEEEIYRSNLIFEKPDKERVLLLTEPLAAMLALFSKEMPSETQSGSDYVYAHILTILDTMYSENLTIERVSRLCHGSKSQISHLFKQKSGETVMSYLRRVRIREAKRMLENSDLTVSEIAYSVGFSDSNYFTYVFGKETGLSPKKYRLNAKK